MFSGHIVNVFGVWGVFNGIQLHDNCIAQLPNSEELVLFHRYAVCRANAIMLACEAPGSLKSVFLSSCKM